MEAGDVDFTDFLISIFHGIMRLASGSRPIFAGRKIWEESPDTGFARSSTVAGNPRPSKDERCEQRRQCRKARHPSWVNRMATCGCNGKILTSVQGRARGIHQLDISRGEPLEVIGNDHPRHMTAHDRIRLIDAVRRPRKGSFCVPMKMFYDADRFNTRRTKCLTLKFMAYTANMRLSILEVCFMMLRMPMTSLSHTDSQKLIYLYRAKKMRFFASMGRRLGWKSTRRTYWHD